MKIAVSGLGYVGLSNAILLAQHNTVVATDILQDRVDAVNNRTSPFSDPEIAEYFEEKELQLTATTNSSEAYTDADFVIIATPTNYNTQTNYFDTSSIENVLQDIMQVNDQALIVIKSTVPVGYVRSLRARFKTERIVFSPEFLREGRALFDNLYPSRIIIGDKSKESILFANLALNGSKNQNAPVLFVGQDEAEAIKLFANTYLAMRVAYFNELDSFALARKLDASEIINGVCLDPRVGNHYNNPSFGYGGYCLPKDTKQLLANYVDVPQNIIQAIVDANRTRKDFLAEQITLQCPKIVGVYRLVMKNGSDNFRHSSILGIIKRLLQNDIQIIVYEPMLNSEYFLGSRVVTDIREFKRECDVIIANRLSDEIMDVVDKVYTRDLFGES